MIRCAECGSQQYPGTLFCTECGTFLLGDGGKTTNVLPFLDTVRPPHLMPAKTEHLDDGNSPKRVLFVIPHSRRRAQIILRDVIRVGRGDEEADVMPEFDLTNDQGLDNGVSREHAMIKLANQGVFLIDLDSTNGTSLNKSRLPANIPYRLHSGDEIRFGDLLVHIFFRD